MSAWHTGAMTALALAACPAGGALATGAGRKLTARMQGRIGPPLLQPFYDVAKLLRKTPIALNQFQVLYAYMHLAFMLLVVVLMAMGQDMLMALLAHAFATIALILGGMCVRSPYSRLGAHRKILQMLAYEPVLVLMVVGMFLVNRQGGHASFLMRDLMSLDRPPLLSLPLVFVAFVAAMGIKLNKSPFDVATSHHAHQELVKGVTLEYSGPYLAIVEITDFIETAVLLWCAAAFGAPSMPLALALATGAFVALVLMDVAFARLTSLWMVRFMLTVPLLLALTNIVWLYL